jgi:hypothetical protein
LALTGREEGAAFADLGVVAVGEGMITGSAPIARAAASTSSRVASGRPKRMLSATVAFPCAKLENRKKRWGTVTLSAVGMVGKGAGWGIPPSSPSICWITVGGIGPKREDLDGEITTRDYLSLGTT